jgi:hypothetical protein
VEAEVVSRQVLKPPSSIWGHMKVFQITTLQAY